MKKITNQSLLLILVSAILFGCNEFSEMTQLEFKEISLTSFQEPVTGDESYGPPRRPNGAIVIDGSFCACEGIKPISIGSCESVCLERSSTHDSDRKLFFDVHLTRTITDSHLQDMYGFCSTQEGEVKVASCYGELKDESGITFSKTPIAPNPGQTSFSVDIGALKKNHTYRFSIVEESSGARSTTRVLRLVPDIPNQTITNPLQLSLVNQYSCLFAVRRLPGGTTSVEEIDKQHFYFTSETRPEPLQESNVSKVYCHDIEKFGVPPINNPLMEEESGVFTFWSKNDPRFYDLDGDSILDIHNIISGKMEDLNFNTTWEQELNLFHELDWFNGLDSLSSELERTKATLGYYLYPLLDDETFRSYCPREEHYSSSDPLLQALGDVIGINTEGIYTAKAEGSCDVTLIRESQLKKIGFHLKDGKPVMPNYDSIAKDEIKFYWPADTINPLVRKSHQIIYTIKAIDELPQVCGIEALEPNYSPSHDKKFGCIPVLEN
jgi:hypothetical protein